MYTLVIIGTHGIEKLQGTPITCIARFNTLEKDESFFAAYLFNEIGQIIDFSRATVFHDHIVEKISTTWRKRNA
jgi:hypothetical protein